MDDADTKYVTRCDAQFRDMSQRFLLPVSQTGRSFCRQYAHLYATRLAIMRPLLEETTRQRWPQLPLRRVCELESEELCIVVGTLVRLGTRHTTVLKELVAEVEGPGDDLLEELPPSRVAAVHDSLYLEDEIQRIELVADKSGTNFDRSRLVTGIVCAILGCVSVEECGRFLVKSVTFVPPPSQPDWPILQEDKWVCVVSGLELGGRRANLLALRLLQEQLSGALWLDGTVPPGQVVRLLIAGNALSRESADQAASVRAKYLRKRIEVKSVAAQALWDKWLSQLLPSLPCALMPGEWDPTGIMLPQQPLHKCMFPRSAAFAANLALLPQSSALRAGWRSLFGQQWPKCTRCSFWFRTTGRWR